MRTTTITALCLLASPLWAQPSIEPASAERARVEQASDKQATEDQRPWWRDAIFYEVFVRSFADATHGPYANDGVGDFQGLIDKLDYLNDGDPTTDTDLGITALWLMPINESETYHGYDIEDYTKVDAELGNNELFKQFVEECNKRGIRVVIDWVINHSSWKNPWFIEALDPDSPKRDWYIFEDPRPQTRGPWGQNVWHDRGREQSGASYYGVFSPTMPDLNLENPAVTEALHDAATGWLVDQQIDGFRLDAVKYLIELGPDALESTPQTLDWLRDFRDHVHAIRPGGFTVGEVWDSTEVVHKYLAHGAMDSAFEFDLSFRLFDALESGDATALGEQIAKLAKVYEADGPVGGHIYSTFLSNHDQTRTMTRVGGDVRKAKLAAAIQMTLPGTPFIYYGEELGMTGDKPDPELRTPKPWNTTEPHAGFTQATPWKPLADDPAEVSVEVADHPGGLRAHYRELIRMRQAEPALRSDDVEIMPTENDAMLVYRRGNPETGLRMFIANLSDQPVEFMDRQWAPYEFVIGDMDMQWYDRTNQE